jgi:hypothetical protein
VKGDYAHDRGTEQESMGWSEQIFIKKKELKEEIRA